MGTANLSRVQGLGFGVPGCRVYMLEGFMAGLCGPTPCTLNPEPFLDPRPKRVSGETNPVPQQAELSAQHLFQLPHRPGSEGLGFRV